MLRVSARPGGGAVAISVGFWHLRRVHAAVSPGEAGETPGDRCIARSSRRLRPVHGRRTRVKHVTGLMGLDEAFRHSWYQRKVVVMADRRDWGGGGDDPEESTQRMIERIWESLTEIRMRDGSAGTGTTSGRRGGTCGPNSPTARGGGCKSHGIGFQSV
ncbi:hypothetical protein Taro_044764 [Colocasia esculenta]|uniref:Uncharacterized protein n=1 Tax=Colocasia esculenta TaxID=4460 RepID=A0A843WMQ3_COLES|nr:hypothetical protein [Colocasia esculenta]